MARPNFFNDNLNRTFPFEVGTAGISTPASGIFTMLQLPDDVVVDCGFIMGPESGYEEGVHTIYLYKISKVSATQLNYEFRCDATALATSPLIFTRQLSDTDYLTEFQESDIPEYAPASQSLSLSESQIDVVCGEPYWSGYLTTGSVSSLSARLSVGDTVTRSATTDVLVHEALVQNLNESQAVSINIGNADRTRALRPVDCAPNEWDFTTGEIYIKRECLQGDIVFSRGYNLSLSQTDATSTIQFGATINAGEGVPCTEVKLFDEEMPPIGASNDLLEGDFYCNQALRTINGLQGPDFTFFAGTGVSITVNPVTQCLIIDVNLIDLSLCTTSTVSVSESV
jgi:hypothetical protein